MQHFSSKFYYRKPNVDQSSNLRQICKYMQVREESTSKNAQPYFVDLFLILNIQTVTNMYANYT